MSRSRRRTVFHSASILLIAILAGTLFVFIENDLRLLDPVLRLLPRLGLYPSVLRRIAEYYLLLFAFGGPIASIVFLIRARFLLALSYLALTASVFVATQVAVVLKGSRFSFPDKVHDDIVEIYRQRRPLISLPRPGFGEIPGLTYLHEACNPPYGCECWIAWGPALDRGIDKDVDRDWHAPRSAQLPGAIVHVRQIDADAYSVIGCEVDLRR